jgi:hypothetical protein
MERGHIPDATALELIEFPGKLGVLQIHNPPAADHVLSARD